MALFRSERGIGRGETPESQIEAPVFLIVAVGYSLLVLAQHLIYANEALTIALAISGVVLGVTVANVDFGVYILIISMLLSPEIELRNVESGMRTFTLRYDDILVIVIFLGVMLKLAFDGRLTPWQPSPINAAIVIFYSLCLFSTLLALQRNLGAWDQKAAFFVLLKMLEYYMVFWLVGHAIVTYDQVRKQLVLFFAVALIVGAYASYSIGSIARVGAPFDAGGTEPNTLGGYLVICMCVALGLFTQSPSFRWQLVFAVIVGMCGLPLLYTLSRASYTAVVAGVFVVALVSRRYWIIALMLLLLALSPIIMPENVIRRVLFTFQSSGGQEIMGGVHVDKSTGERFLVWRKVRFILNLAPIYTLFGGGVMWERVLDSQYARVILETGLAGLAAFAFLQVRILKTLREAYRWTDDWVGRGLAMGMFGAAVAMIVHSLGTISFLIVRIMLPFWLLTALCVFVRNEAYAKHWARHLARQRANPKGAGTPQQEGERPQLSSTA